MPLDTRIETILDDIIRWRRELHAHPETAFEETWTSDRVAELLESFGVEVHRGIATTGVVGVLEGRDPGPGVGLRVELDALRVQELTQLPHASQQAGVMHACGHDGHMAMLLGAAKVLAASRDFAGTATFIFQPAEELAGGAQRMVEEGLFDRFPMERIFALHNFPDLPAGVLGIRPGPILAAGDIFEIVVHGRGTHGAMPQLGIDPIVVCSAIVQALQTVVSRRIPALESGVVSVTQIQAGDAFNVIPDRCTLRGTCRSHQPAIREQIEGEVRQLTQGIATAHGAEVEINFQTLVPPTVNASAEAERAAVAAEQVVGAAQIVREFPPSMGSEDFAYFLAERPGAMLGLGSGLGEGGHPLHSPHYDFNEEILCIGASFWVKLIEAAEPGRPDTGPQQA